MNVLRKLAWAAMLMGSGMPSSEGPRPGPSVPAGPDAASSAPAPVPAGPLPVASSEPAIWPLDLDEDEFEGEGWSFWPLAGPRR